MKNFIDELKERKIIRIAGISGSFDYCLDF